MKPKDDLYSTRVRTTANARSTCRNRPARPFRPSQRTMPLRDKKFYNRLSTASCKQRRQSSFNWMSNGVRSAMAYPSQGLLRCYAGLVLFCVSSFAPFRRWASVEMVVVWSLTYLASLPTDAS